MCQSRENSCASDTFSPFAMRDTFRIEMFLFPRSTSARKLLSIPTPSAVGDTPVWDGDPFGVGLCSSLCSAEYLRFCTSWEYTCRFLSDVPLDFGCRHQTRGLRVETPFHLVPVVLSESSDMLLYLAGVNEHAFLRIVGSKRWSVAHFLETIQYLFEYGFRFLAT